MAKEKNQVQKWLDEAGLVSDLGSWMFIIAFAVLMILLIFVF